MYESKLLKKTGKEFIKSSWTNMLDSVHAEHLNQKDFYYCFKEYEIVNSLVKAHMVAHELIAASSDEEEAEDNLLANSLKPVVGTNFE